MSSSNTEVWQQQVAMARAIAKNPAVLLCDEPTGALDSATGIVVLDALERINRKLGTTTVVITHNATIADMADRVIHLSDGLITAVERNEHKNYPASCTGKGTILAGRWAHPMH